MAFIGDTADDNVGGKSEAMGEFEVAGEFEAALAKAKSGDSDGYRALFNEYNRVIAAVALTEGCPKPDQTVNAVFVKAFRSIDRFVGGRSNFASFLYQIARFQITDERRARNRMADTDEPDDQSIDLTRVGQSSERLENAAKTSEALQALTAEQREVMVLRIFFGLTGPETAAALDKPVDAVRSLQNRAEARLRAKAEAGSVLL